MSNIMMKCGCAAQGVDAKTEKPVCIIHNEDETADIQPNLVGRRAQCHCGYQQDSSLVLAYFRFQPLKPVDGFYCGCNGWD
jgi:hypothetical protein